MCSHNLDMSNTQQPGTQYKHILVQHENLVPVTLAFERTWFFMLYLPFYSGPSLNILSSEL